MAEASLPADASEYESQGMAPGQAGRVADRDTAFAAGLAAIDRAATLLPGAPEPAVSRALALRVWADRTRDPERRQTRWGAARAAWDQALVLAPRWPEVYDEAAATALRAGDAEAALGLARRALDVDGFFRRAWRTAAEAHVARTELAAAADAYREYFVDYRNASDVTTQRARLAVLMRLGRDDEALQVARDVAQLAPDDPFALADLAVLLERGGDPSAALEAAQRAVRLAPDDAGIAALLRRLEGGGED